MTQRPTPHRLTPDRRLAIEKWNRFQCDPVEEVVDELLAEIDALSAEINYHKEGSQITHELLKQANERDQLKSDYETLRSECNTHRENARAYKAENENLKRIIAKELTENDELGCEFTYVITLKEENEKLKLCQKIDGIALASLNEKNQKLRERIGKLIGALLEIREEPNRVNCGTVALIDEMVKKYSICAWKIADEALAQDDKEDA